MRAQRDAMVRMDGIAKNTINYGNSNYLSLVLGGFLELAGIGGGFCGDLSA